MTARTVTERVKKLRSEREKLGLVRMEIYANPDDHAAIKECAARLLRKRYKSSKPLP